jgi:hypothetical protein
VRTLCIFPFEEKPRRFAISMMHGRLCHRDFARFRNSTVHDSIELYDGGRPVLLRNVMNHSIFRSHAHALEKINSYSSMQAEDLGSPIDTQWDVTRAAHIADKEALLSAFESKRARNLGTQDCEFQATNPLHRFCLR